jgi:hypothetical protein
MNLFTARQERVLQVTRLVGTPHLRGDRADGLDGTALRKRENNKETSASAYFTESGSEEALHAKREKVIAVYRVHAHFIFH